MLFEGLYEQHIKNQNLICENSSKTEAARELY